MSYVHRPALQPLEHRTLMQLFDIHANNHPDREAFVLYDQTGQRSSYTFQHMQQQSLYLAASFLRLGWKRGQRVILMMPNRIEFLVSYMALHRIGANLILVPPAGKNVQDVIDMIKHSKSHGVVLCSSKDDSFDSQLMSSLEKIMTSPAHIVCVDAEHAGISRGGHSYYGDLIKTADQLEIDRVIHEQQQVQFDDAATVLFTSGSTGLPKGVQHTHHSFLNNAILIGTSVLNIKGSHDDQAFRLFNDRPFYWSGCQCLGVLIVVTMGYTLVSVSPYKSVKEQDVDFVMSVLQDEKCTHALLMPYILKDIADNPHVGEYDVSRLTLICTSGQPLQRSIFKQVRSIIPHPMYLEVYGITESSGVATAQVFSPESDVCNDEGMQVLPSMELKVVDEDDNVVPVGAVGELCFRSPLSFLGYLDNNESTSQVMSRSGWFHTGDLGTINQGGQLKICGRNSDMIKRATVKIFPAEIEKVLIKYPDVHDVIVVGVPDERLYEELCACVIPRSGSILESSGSEFEEWMTRQWTPDEQGLTLRPKYLVILAEFPKTKTGKTDRKAITIIAATKLEIELS